MRTDKKLAIENLERREVFSATPGFEGLEAPQATDQEIIDALNAGTQLTTNESFDGSDVGWSVTSPRDPASGMASALSRIDPANVDQLLAERQELDSILIWPHQTGIRG